MRALRRKVDSRHIGALNMFAPFFVVADGSVQFTVGAFPKGHKMLDRESQPFDACLPRLERPVRISSLHDARIFARRWVIRDKDPALKALVRRLDKARSS